MTQALGLRRVLGRPAQLKTPSICLFCSLSPSTRSPSASATLLRSRRTPQRHQSTSPTPTTPSSSSPRTDLQNALLALQSHAPNHINLARLQLALRNLSQPPGHESVRVAFLSLPNSNPTPTAKRLLRLALADPLAPAAPWESQLEAHDTAAHPLVVRVDAAAEAEPTIGVRADGGLTAGREHVIPELRASSPLLNGGNLEVLVAEVGVDGEVLVPTVDVAATTAGHAAPVASPVHMALLVGDGVLGAASVLSRPMMEEREVVEAAVNFGKLGEGDLGSCPIVRVNVDAGREGLELFRADVGNAMKYNALWAEANVGRITEWLRGNAMPGEDGVTKAPVRNLISSLLRSARAAIQGTETQDLEIEQEPTVSTETVAHLNRALAEWAQDAHEELQQQLDAAFGSRSWSKLSWWKLFWRADDVGMVTSEMIALRYLPEAEKRIIYLAGRIEEAGLVEGRQGHPLYTGPALPPTGPHRQDEVAPNTIARWPTYIPFTRNYLHEKTVPPLQALAQKLVVQSASLAGLSSVLAGLSYLSALGVYESGAIAALGIIFSFRRFQQKWDAAREYWEGEVREEGRKAIRATESSVAAVLDQEVKPRGLDVDRTAELEELRKAEELIQRAEDALARMK